MKSKCINLNGWVGLFANILVFARMLLYLNLINMRAATYVCAFLLVNGMMWCVLNAFGRVGAEKGNVDGFF